MFNITSGESDIHTLPEITGAYEYGIFVHSPTEFTKTATFYLRDISGNMLYYISAHVDGKSMITAMVPMNLSSLSETHHLSQPFVYNDIIFFVVTEYNKVVGYFSQHVGFISLGEFSFDSNIYIPVGSPTGIWAILAYNEPDMSYDVILADQTIKPNDISFGIDTRNITSPLKFTNIHGGNVKIYGPAIDTLFTVLAKIDLTVTGLPSPSMKADYINIPSMITPLYNSNEWVYSTNTELKRVNIKDGVFVMPGILGSLINLGDETIYSKYAKLYINGIRTPFRKYNHDTGVWERLDNFFGEE